MINNSFIFTYFFSGTKRQTNTTTFTRPSRYAPDATRISRYFARGIPCISIIVPAADPYHRQRYIETSTIPASSLFNTFLIYWHLAVDCKDEPGQWGCHWCISDRACEHDNSPDVRMADPCMVVINMSEESLVNTTPKNIVLL